MRRQYSLVPAVSVMLVLGSCASPTYTYNFDYYDYNSGRKVVSEVRPIEPNSEINSPLTLQSSALIASLESDQSSSLRNSHTDLSKRKAVPSEEFSKAERKELKRELKKYIKDRSKQTRWTATPSSVNATKQLDDDLKLSIIFGAIGITFAILGGINTIFWVIGVIGLIVGLVFFIRWISTQ